MKDAEDPREQTGTEQTGNQGNARFRTELHGIRGVALALVVVYHLFGDGRVSGGIDVFLTITGFLITGSLLRRAVAGGGRLGLRAHYARLAQRLLPPLVVVCAAVAVASLALLPSTRLLQVARELTASILYYENWELIRSQLTYDAAGPETSPLQHIWSLSIQGQLHVVWPLLVLAAAWAASRLRRSPALALGVVLALAFVASFGLAIHGMIQDPEVTYFHTGARLWQPALGGLVALILPLINLPRGVRIASGWLGLALIGTCGLVLDGAALFPGPAALWPVVGLILVLAAGFTGSRYGADRILSSTWLRFVADISYSLYLWHWPVLVFYLVLAQRDRVGLTGALIILAVSVPLAWLTWRLVEVRGARQARPVTPDPPSPVRPANLQRPVIATVSAAVLAVAFASSTAVLSMREDLAVREMSRQDPADPESAGDAHGASRHPGAAALAWGFPIPSIVDPADVVPRLEALQRDLPEIYEWGCTQLNREGAEFTEVLICHDDTVAEPRARVVVSGGSFVIHWWPALREIAAENDWELLVIEKDGCLLTADRDDSRGMPMSETCFRWNESALDVIVAQEPDAVFTLGSFGRGADEWTPPGMTEAWSSMGEHGIQVLAMRSSTRLEESVPDCLAEKGYRPIECGGPRSASFGAGFPFIDPPEYVTFLDMSSYLCTDDVCPAIIGNVIVYRDTGHITTTFMRTLTPFLDSELRRGAPWLFD